MQREQYHCPKWNIADKKSDAWRKWFFGFGWINIYKKEMVEV